MAVQTFVRPYDYDPSVTKEAVVGEPHKIPASAPYHIFLRHVPRQQTPSTVKVSGGGIAWTEVSTPPSASGQYRVRYDEALGRIEFHASDAGREITVNYNACGTVVWGEDHGDGRPNIAEMQEVLERVQEAGGIDYASAVSGFSSSDVKAALDALAGVRLIEMGANSNGSYVRFENGWQVCWQTVTVSDKISSTRMDGTWTYPALFTASPTVPVGLGTHRRDGSITVQHLAARAQLVVASGCSLRVTGESGAFEQGVSEVLVECLAIGRWK